MGITIRPVADDDEYTRWNHTAEIPFGSLGDEKRLELERAVMPLDRTFTALVGDRMVGGASSYPFRMTVPGGARVPVAGVTAVSVLATHRRRGVLRSLMAHQLDDCVARGETIAILNASEAHIYPRFGYGLAQRYQSLRIVPERAGLRPDALAQSAGRDLHYVAQADAAPELAPIFDAYAASRPGEIDRSDAYWVPVLDKTETWKGGGELHIVVCEPKPGVDEGGYVTFKMRERTGSSWFEAHVVELVATGRSAEVALWELVLSIDLSDLVTVDAVPVDDLLRWWVADTRQVHVTEDRDYLFVRLLDVVAALEARTYERPGTVVLDVVDAFRPATSGTYRLDVDGDGKGRCERVDGADPDLRISIDHLGAVYLGDTRVDHLVGAGRVDELRPGAAVEATEVFRTSLAPMCLTRF